MDLGRKMKSPGTLPASPVSEKEPKITYPSFGLSDEIAKAFLKEYDCELGDELTATVKLKVTRMSEDEYGSSVGFDVISMDGISDAGESEKSDEDEAPEPDAEEKVLGYKRKAEPKEAPAIKPSDLED